MGPFVLSRSRKSKQYLVSVSFILCVAGAGFLISPFAGYKVVALMLLAAVSLLAMSLDIVPVLFAALLSALIWNFFFIPPKFTLQISNAEDALLLLMYFLVALVNAVLTSRIRAIEKKINQKEEKAKAGKLYDTLLNSLSHELRTPISTIIGATDNLQTDNGKLSLESKAELINEISTASLRLNRHVENLLNMSRLESGSVKVRKDWCDVNEMIHQVVARLKENLDQRAISVLVNDNLPLFKLDYGLIEQVIYNLVHNAALYVPKYCMITVGAECMDEKLLLIIEDNGNGFPQDEIGNVFDKFYRLKGTDTGGTGLGLSIVKGFVEAHNGTIILENVAGGGARFTIEIPAETSYINRLKNE